MVIGAYQSTSTMGDIFMLFSLGALGWLMKHGGWPPAPSRVGFVLSGPMEREFWLANQIHGWSWLTRPGVLIIGSIIVIPLVLSAWRWVRTRKTPGAAGPGDEDADPPDDNRGIALALAAVAFAMFAYALWEMFTFNPASRLMPALAIVPGLPLMLWLLVRGIRGYRNDFARDAGELRILIALIAYAAAVWAVGLSLPTIGLLAWMLFVRAGMRVWTGLLYGAIVFGAVRILFDTLRGDAPVGALLPIS